MQIVEFIGSLWRSPVKWVLAATIVVSVVAATWCMSLPDSTIAPWLLSESVVFLFTTLVFYLILEWDQQQKAFARRLMMYREIRIFVNDQLITWQRAYESSVPKPLPANQRMLIREGIDQVRFYLNSKSNHPNVIPRTTWLQHLLDMNKQANKRAKVLIDRFGTELPEDVYLLLNEFAVEHCSFEYAVSLEEMLGSSGDLLFDIWKPDRNYKKLIILALEWCLDEYPRLAVSRLGNYAEPIVYKPENHSNNPRCMHPEPYANILVEYDDYCEKVEMVPGMFKLNKWSIESHSRTNQPTNPITDSVD